MTLHIERDIFITVNIILSVWHYIFLFQVMVIKHYIQVSYERPGDSVSILFLLIPKSFSLIVSSQTSIELVIKWKISYAIYYVFF